MISQRTYSNKFGYFDNFIFQLLHFCLQLLLFLPLLTTLTPTLLPTTSNRLGRFHFAHGFLELLLYILPFYSGTTSSFFLLFLLVCFFLFLLRLRSLSLLIFFTLSLASTLGLGLIDTNLTQYFSAF